MSLKRKVNRWSEYSGGTLNGDKSKKSNCEDKMESTEGEEEISTPSKKKSEKYNDSIDKKYSITTEMIKVQKFEKQTYKVKYAS